MYECLQANKDHITISARKVTTQNTCYVCKSSQILLVPVTEAQVDCSCLPCSSRVSMNDMHACVRQTSMSNINRKRCPTAMPNGSVHGVFCCADKTPSSSQERTHIPGFVPHSVCTSTHQGSIDRAYGDESSITKQNVHARLQPRFNNRTARFG